MTIFVTIDPALHVLYSRAPCSRLLDAFGLRLAGQLLLSLSKHVVGASDEKLFATHTAAHDLRTAVEAARQSSSASSAPSASASSAWGSAWASAATYTDIAAHLERSVVIIPLATLNSKDAQLALLRSEEPQLLEGHDGRMVTYKSSRCQRLMRSDTYGRSAVIRSIMGELGTRVSSGTLTANSATSWTMLMVSGGHFHSGHQDGEITPGGNAVKIITNVTRGGIPFELGFAPSGSTGKLGLDSGTHVVSVQIPSGCAAVIRNEDLSVGSFTVADGVPATLVGTSLQHGAFFGRNAPLSTKVRLAAQLRVVGTGGLGFRGHTPVVTTVYGGRVIRGPAVSAEDACPGGAHLLLSNDKLAASIKPLILWDFGANGWAGAEAAMRLEVGGAFRNMQASALAAGRLGVFHELGGVGGSALNSRACALAEGGHGVYHELGGVGGSAHNSRASALAEGRHGVYHTLGGVGWGAHNSRVSVESGGQRGVGHTLGATGAMETACASSAAVSAAAPGAVDYLAKGALEAVRVVRISKTGEVVTFSTEHDAAARTPSLTKRGETAMQSHISTCAARGSTRVSHAGYGWVFEADLLADPSLKATIVSALNTTRYRGGIEGTHCATKTKRTFANQSAAIKTLEAEGIAISNGNLNNVLGGTRKSAGGYKWRRVEAEEDEEG